MTLVVTLYLPGMQFEFINERAHPPLEHVYYPNQDNQVPICQTHMLNQQLIKLPITIKNVFKANCTIDQVA